MDHVLQDCIKNTRFSEVEEVVKAQEAGDRWKQFFFNRTSRKVTNVVMKWSQGCVFDD